jgi:hypothetical protein
MVFGLSEAAVDPVPAGGFVVGVAFGMVPLFAKGWDVFDRIKQRLRPEWCD